MKKRMTQVFFCVCIDISCCWAHTHLPNHHDIVVLWECRPSDFDKIIPSLVYPCDCVVGYLCRSFVLILGFLLALTHFHPCIICTSIKISNVILYELSENKGKSGVYKAYIYLKPQFSAFQWFKLLNLRQKLPYHILILMDSRIAQSSPGCTMLNSLSKSGISCP